MNKIFGIIAFIVSIICCLLCIINIFISLDTYGKQKDRINKLDERVKLLEQINVNNSSSNDKKVEENSSLGSYDTSKFNKIKAQQLAELSANKKIIVWIGRSGCSHCADYAPRIAEFGTKLNETIYYIDLTTIFDTSSYQVTVADEEAYNIMINFPTDEENKDIMTKFGATPMTLIIENNKIVGSYTGAIPDTEIATNLQQEGFNIPE